VNNRFRIAGSTGVSRINLPDNGITAADGINLGIGANIFRGNASNAIFFESTNGHYFRVGGNNVAVAFSGEFLIQRVCTLSAPNLSGSFATPAMSITQLWNTTGSPDAIRLNVTDTASGANANLINLQLAGVSQFKVSNQFSVNF
jgi:hypothetical protein